MKNHPQDNKGKELIKVNCFFVDSLPEPAETRTMKAARALMEIALAGVIGAVAGACLALAF